ncbi:MAG: DUF4167 domain-containing protein [Micavibrio sp.]|nr:DUF4167 domain-containing protein [Micavibrio sp.]
MRHNQNNGRRFRGRSNSAGGGNNGNGGGHHSHSNNGGNGGGGNHRRVNPRMQSFDSNGPDVRIRGTAYQITEKYITLARDATSSGDRVLAESYLQHAEHYQRMINEMTEEYNKYNPPYQPQQQQQGNGEEQPPELSVEQPHVPLNDLDQGFLVGNRSSGQPQQQQSQHNNQHQQKDQPSEEGAQVQHRNRAPAPEPVG